MAETYTPTPNPQSAYADCYVIRKSGGSLVMDGPSPLVRWGEAAAEREAEALQRLFGEQGETR
jgi:hypothetical protein